MPSDAPDVTPSAIDVVILTWNDAALADAAIAAAARSEGVTVHLHVVDNGSTAPYCPQTQMALLRRPVNEGVAAGRNIGARSGSAPLICFVDSDALLTPGALRSLADALSDPEVAMAVPVFEGQPPEASAGARPTILRKILRGLGLTSRYHCTGRGGPIKPVDFAIGACQLVRRSTFESLGGLDARYFFGPEDIDFCDRIRKAGWKIVQVESAGVLHDARRSHRNIFTIRGLRHALALARFYARSKSKFS